MLLDDYSIYFYATVGAHNRTVATPYTRVGPGHVGEVISPVVDLFCLKRESVGRTCHHTQVATLASLFIYHYGTFYFCHNLIVLSYI